MSKCDLIDVGVDQYHYCQRYQENDDVDGDEVQFVGGKTRWYFHRMLHTVVPTSTPIKYIQACPK